ncbi:MAG: GntR family transcriptional regulator [Bdellovibrio sp.]|nr:GntR family transcriptional regulator [Bdellovibrio sp.]
MVQIGKYNQLKVLKFVEFGLYLDAGDGHELLLPKREIERLPENVNVGDMVDVFVCYDSEDRPIATTLKPAGTVGEFAIVKVVAVEQIGAFLDWGLTKDLFLPFAEQNRDVRVGLDIIVYIYLDKSNRISASMRIERNLDQVPVKYETDQSVELLIFGKTDLGYKAIINGQSLGMLFHNDVFKPLVYAQRISGFIKNVRDDGKIDLSLMKSGHKGAQDIGPQILAFLKQKGGFAPINDKTSAEAIYDLFGVSKKKYKIALGGLYKSRLIKVADDGIYLLEKTGDSTKS